MKQLLPAAWYSDARWVRLLLPLSLLYGLLSNFRRQRLEQRRARYRQAGVPVVVIGNITVGGTGKTPLTLALAAFLVEQGMHPVIISRGYGGHSAKYPLQVHAATDVRASGDEALLMAQQMICPVVVAPRRLEAIQYAEEQLQADVILCDDGLQHYAMARQIEIAVLDGSRGLGNGLLLPAGPLREPATRLQEVQHVVVNGALRQALPALTVTPASMQMEATGVRNLGSGEVMDLDAFRASHGNEPVHAVAGMGNPQRFFDTLDSSGFVIMPHAFPDHHRYRRDELDFGDGLQVLMTEKDAVKCSSFAGLQHWALQVRALPDATLLHQVHAEIMTCTEQS